MLYARLRDVKKELNQWVGELPYVQYSKNNAYHSGIRTTPYRVHFGRAPADLSVDMTLPKEVVERLETEDDLCGVLESRQVIGYASFDPSSDTPIASPNPLPFSHLSCWLPTYNEMTGIYMDLAAIHIICELLRQIWNSQRIASCFPHYDNEVQ